jgi:hypothetical protein
MKDGPDELRDDVDNPFLRIPYSPFYVPKPFPRGASKRDLLRRLKVSLAEMQLLCQDATLGSGKTGWPSEGWLEELSENIWRLSLSHKRGGKDPWSCIKAIDNRCAQRLGAKIEKLINRAAKLYYEPAAIAMQRQGFGGNQVAFDCFAALKRCHDGISHMASENWAKYAKVLQPSSAESCEAKAAQLVIDWLLDDLSPDKPWDHLASWLSTLGNPTLASKLLRPDRAQFYALVFGATKRSRSKLSSPLRQRRYRRRQNDPMRRSLLRILEP